MPETEGQALEELDEMFGDGSAQEEKEMMRQAAVDARRKSLTFQHSA